MGGYTVPIIGTKNQPSRGESRPTDRPSIVLSIGIVYGRSLYHSDIINHSRSPILKPDRLILIVAGDLLYKKVAPGDSAKAL